MKYFCARRAEEQYHDISYKLRFSRDIEIRHYILFWISKNLKRIFLTASWYTLWLFHTKIYLLSVQESSIFFFNYFILKFRKYENIFVPQYLVDA